MGQPQRIRELNIVRAPQPGAARDYKVMSGERVLAGERGAV
jgi:hypothetical protein